jgi:hypothetical protein
MQESARMAVRVIAQGRECNCSVCEAPRTVKVCTSRSPADIFFIGLLVQTMRHVVVALISTFPLGVHHAAVNGSLAVFTVRTDSTLHCRLVTWPRWSSAVLTIARVLVGPDVMVPVLMCTACVVVVFVVAVTISTWAGRQMTHAPSAARVFSADVPTANARWLGCACVVV